MNSASTLSITGRAPILPLIVYVPTSMEDTVA